MVKIRPGRRTSPSSDRSQTDFLTVLEPRPLDELSENGSTGTITNEPDVTIADVVGSGNTTTEENTNEVQNANEICTNEIEGSNEIPIATEVQSEIRSADENANQTPQTKTALPTSGTSGDAVEEEEEVIELRALIEHGTYFAAPQGPPNATVNKLTSFQTSQFPSPPKVIAGLNYLDFNCRKNVRAKVLLDDISEDFFRPHIETWADTHVYGVGCDWLALHERLLQEKHIEVGSFNTLEDHDWRHPQTTTLKEIKFDRPYDHVPTVVVMLNAIDMYKWKNQRVHAFASNITVDGFTLNINTWNNSILYSAGASWLAYDPVTTKGIQAQEFVGKHDDMGVMRFKKDVFDKWSTPSHVIVVFNKIDAWCWKNLRVRVDIEETTHRGTIWKLQTWNNSRLYGAGAWVIALA